MSLFDLTQQDFNEEVLRLLAIRLEVPDDAACTAACTEYGESWRPKASLVIEMEPMSYRLTRESDPPGTNLPEIFRIPVTYSSAERGLTVAELAGIREGGWLAIPKNKVVQNPRTIKAKKAEALNLPYQRWSKYAMEAGLHVDINTLNGQPFSDDVGKMFVVKSGSDEFPRGGDQTYTRWMGYIAAPAFEYVAAPLDERPVRVIQERETEGAVAPSAVATQTGGNNTAALAAAVRASGMHGMKVGDLDTREQQVSFVTKALRVAPILATREVSSAAGRGELIEFLQGKGALVVVNGVIQAGE